MDVKLSIAIMAHPRRIQHVRDVIKPALKECEFLTVSYDMTARGLWWNARRCWLAWREFPERPTHHMVIQDDAIPCKDFFQGAVMAHTVNPEAFISYYGTPSGMKDALARGDHWVAVRGALWGVCNAMPVAMIEDFITWDARHIAPEFKHDDIRLGLYSYTQGIYVWFPVPCLVQHGGGGKESIMRHNVIAVARYCLKQNESPMGWDWTLPDHAIHRTWKPIERDWRAYKD